MASPYGGWGEGSLRSPTPKYNVDRNKISQNLGIKAYSLKKVRRDPGCLRGNTLPSGFGSRKIRLSGGTLPAEKCFAGEKLKNNLCRC